MFYRLSILLLVPLMWLGCSEPRSWGEWDEVTVFIDSLDQRQLEPLLRDSFEEHSISPQLEPWFQLNYVAQDQLNDYANRRLLLFVAGNIDSESPVNSYVRSLFGQQELERIRSGERLLFARENALARPQLVLIMPAPDYRSFASLLEERDSSLVQQFLRFTLEQAKEQIYSRFEQEELADSLKRMLQVDMRVPHDYQVVNVRPEANLLRLRRYYPDRWIAVQTLPGLPVDPYDPVYLLDLRDSLGVHFYDQVYVERDPDFFRVSPITVNGHDGVSLEGLWGTFAMIGGGPYVMYLFPDHTNNRTVLLDGAVFAPGEDKNPFLIQLMSILESYGETP